VGRRFQPGRSGNPRGGPKRPAPRTAEVEWLFSQSFTVEIDGERQRLPLAQALLLSLAHRALKGDARAASELLALHGKAEETRAAQAAAKAKKAAEDRARRTAEEAEAEALKPPVIYWSNGPRPALEALGVVHVLPSGRWQIQRRAYRILLAADPGLLDGASHDAKGSLRDCLEREAAEADVTPNPPG
jgi:hypothetical protein